VQVKYPVNLTAYRCHEDILSQDARSLKQVRITLAVIIPCSYTIVSPQEVLNLNFYTIMCYLKLKKCASWRSKDA